MGDSKFQKSERALVTLLKKKKKKEEEKLGQLRYFIVTILVDYHNQPFIIFIDTRARSLSSFVECRTENTEWKRKFFVASTKKSSGDPRWPSIPRLILLEYAVDRARDAASILDAILSLSLFRRGNRAAFFHYAALFFCRGQSEPAEGFWRLVVRETCEYESVKREIGTRCRDW